MKSHRTLIDHALLKLERYLETTGWRGYDPFDALNSPIVRTLSFNQMWLRVAWTQLLRRSPINLRPILFTAKGTNPKGIGLFLAATVKRFQETGEERFHERALELIAMLDGLRVEGYAGPCWGYNFDWQNTKFLFKKGTPTLVNTAFIVDALLDAHAVWGESRWLDTARKACDFVMTDIHRTGTPDGLCFSYTPQDESMVYNASILGGRLLARVGHLTGERELLDLAAETARFLVSRQRPDGAWAYGEWSMQQHVDSYHTGFNLEALMDIHRFMPELDLGPAIQKGLDFYIHHLFLADGFPKFLSDQVYPVDIHNISALVPLVKGMAYLDTMDAMERISNWFIRHMQGKDGHFYFRKGRGWTNKTAFIRWGQAWSYHALTTYKQHLIKTTMGTTA